ncbi:MAG: hypothetical protein HKP61_22350 [Dactylosporangium sp.]|nr:hypothetical protein [Dactylosporangium sp.]
MGAPNPGAGQFYLRCEDTRPAAKKDDLPTREWGAKPDRLAAGNEVPARAVRGRKYYWHADPDRQEVPRHVARPHQSNDSMAVERLLAEPGTVLTQVVTFDNLSEAELGSLLAALQPHSVLPPGAPGGRSLRLHLGGGKPLGLGSCHASVEDLRVWTAQSRYGAAAPVDPDPDRYIERFVASVPPPVSVSWTALGAVLAEDTVDPERVWYPPGEHWPDQESPDPKARKRFDEPFAFFTATSGMHLEQDNSRSLCPLPDPAAADQTIPIIRKSDLGKGSREVDG